MPLTKQTWCQNYTQWIKNSNAPSSADLQKDALMLTASISICYVTGKFQLVHNLANMADIW